jgi:heat shock protein HslJ
MKAPALLLLLLAMTANKCADKSPASMTGLLDRKWVFQSLDGRRLEVPDGVETPWLKLSGERLQGFGGCNALMGDFALSGEKLSFANIGSTKKYCEGVQPLEESVKSALSRTDGVRMGSGEARLMGAGKELALLRSE